jgi:hypothetical protein
VPDHIAAAVIFLPARKIFEMGVFSFAFLFEGLRKKDFVPKARVNPVGYF